MAGFDRRRSRPVIARPWLCTAEAIMPSAQRKDYSLTIPTTFSTTSSTLGLLK